MLRVGEDRKDWQKEPLPKAVVEAQKAPETLPPQEEPKQEVLKEEVKAEKPKTQRKPKKKPTTIEKMKVEE